MTHKETIAEAKLVREMNERAQMTTNMGDAINDFLVEVRERGGFANDMNFDLIVGQVFAEKIKAEAKACAEIAARYQREEKEQALEFARKRQEIPRATHAVLSVMCSRIAKEINRRWES